MFSGRITNCYDSHVHWLGTGDFFTRLDLHQLTNAEDVVNLQTGPEHHRGDWLLGFGWNQNAWPSGEFPTREILDRTFGLDRPVLFWRADAHAVWVNTAVLERAGLMREFVADPQGGKILRDPSGKPTGVLIDKAMLLVEKYLPQFSDKEVQRSLLNGIGIFHRAGITHIRDMSCDIQQWEQSLHLEESGLLTLAVEQYMSLEDGREFSDVLKFALEARKTPSQRLRVRGIKAFLDGALGSEGAWLSCDYMSGSGHGLQLIPLSEVEHMMRETWSQGLDLALHCIGDEAAHQIVLSAHKVKNAGVRGHLHLEHAELLRPETIAMMNSLTVFCHLQPCHWLSDHKRLQGKIGSLNQVAFPWRALQEASIPFDFGSDSPIERPSIADNVKALKESAIAGIPALLGDPLKYQSHPDLAWVPNTYSLFQDGQVRQVIFNGEHVL